MNSQQGHAAIGRVSVASDLERLDAMARCNTAIVGGTSARRDG